MYRSVNDVVEPKIFLTPASAFAQQLRSKVELSLLRTIIEMQDRSVLITNSILSEICLEVVAMNLINDHFVGRR